MKKVLVTGGSGFIGKHLIATLRRLDIPVIVLDKKGGHIATSLNGCDFEEADILSRQIVREILEQVDTCFHLAAIVSVAQCNRDWIFSHQNNVTGFNIVLDEIVRSKHPIKLVYASSSAVYGDNPSVPLTENAAANPISAYGADKRVNEIYAQMVEQSFGVPSIGLRFFNVYGDGQQGNNPYSGVMVNFRERLMQETPLFIYGDGSQTRDFIHVSDVVSALLKAAYSLPKKSGMFNVCTGNNISIKELAQLMIRTYGVTTPIIYQPPRAGDILHSLGCPKKASDALGFRAQVTIEEGIRKLYDGN